MKRLLLFVALALCMVGTSQAQESEEDFVAPLQVETEAQYKSRYKSTLDWLSNVAELSKFYIADIKSMWFDVVEETVYNNMYVYRNKERKDFSEALNIYLEEWRNSDLVAFRDYEKLPDRIKDRIKSLNNYPQSLRDGFEGILELGFLVDELCSHVINPTGSYNSYSKTTDELIHKINRKFYELEILYTY
ncbi:MAG: hypothetical protein K2J31_03670 [Alistipes sp.]|nr:hypothetical protein [Alistipes sp.]MDE6861832.1 hypothetical protein [Alistipes sp.]MDE7128826.1 hypothetical protein [Alistipes sp.]